MSRRNNNRFPGAGATGRLSEADPCVSGGSEHGSRKALDPWHPWDKSRPCGIALLEVVLAGTLFVLTAFFVLSGLQASRSAVERSQQEAEAEDAAVTVLSRVQMGAFPLVSAPPEPIHAELFPGWTYELVVTGMEDTPDWPTLKRVEIILRHEERGYTHRLYQLFLDEPLEEEPQ